jgi:hypothetical protein
METRVTKKSVVALGPDQKDNYMVTWLLEAWPNGIPLTETPIISEEINHDFFKYDPEEPNTQEDYAKQQERIDDFLEKEAKKIMDKHIAESDMLATETRLNDSTNTLQAKLDTTYGDK